MKPGHGGEPGVLGAHHVHVLGVGVDVVAEHQEQLGPGGRDRVPDRLGAGLGGAGAEGDPAERPGGRGGGAAALGLDDVRDRGGGPGRLGVVVLPEQGGERGGHLGLGHGPGLGPLAECGGVGAEDGEPDRLRALDLLAVAPPALRRVAAAVVGGHDQRGRAAVLRVRLELVPERLEGGVGVVGGTQVLVVAAAVRVFVGVPEPDVEHARRVAAEVLQGDLEREDVVAAVRPSRGRNGS